MAIGPIHTSSLLPVPVGQRQVPALQDEENGRNSEARRAEGAQSRFAEQLQESPEDTEQQGAQTGQLRQAVSLEEISPDLPRGSLLDISV